METLSLEVEEAERTGPVTVVISRHVKPGCEAAYEIWMQNVLEEVNRFPGYLGTNILRPHSKTQPEFVAILRFDSYANLSLWEHSEVRHEWLRRAEAFADVQRPLQHLNGLEFWFTPPAAGAPAAPSRNRMAALLILIIFGLSSWVTPHIRTALSQFPLAVQSLAVSAFQVILLMYFVMPALTRRLSRFLFPASA